MAIKCKNVHGDYESKAVGGLDGTGAFSVPLADDLHGADCIAQLHSAASNTPCPGQEPSKVVPVSEGTTYGVVPGAKATTASPECASVTLCGPIKKHILEHFHHKKPEPSKPEYKPQPHPDYHPVPYKPEPKPQPHPDYHPVPPTPTYGGGGGHPSTPIYHAETSKTFLGPVKKHIIEHIHHKKEFLEHFHHKKPMPSKPEYKPQPHPDYHPVPYKPEPKPQPHLDYHPVPPTPTYGGGGGHPSSPIYHAETSKTMLGPIKKHIIEHFHHKKPMPSKPEPKPQPHPDYHPVPPTPTYGGGGGHPSTPIYHPPAQH